jgi:putative DNA primase/helicase
MADQVPDRPEALPVLADGVPAELKALRQWVLWRYEPNDKRTKWTKVPYQARKPGAKADSTKPTTWATFEEALASYQRGGVDGVGLVFSAGDPYCGIDLDRCRDPESGEIQPWARRLLDRLNGYSEVSPSQTGVKVFVEAKHDWGGHKRQYQGGAVEVYDQGRYFTVTGHRLDAYPATIEQRQTQAAEVWRDVLESSAAKPKPSTNGASVNAAATRTALGDEEVTQRARLARNGGAFARLWAGDASDHGGDASSADLALCSLLRFWTGGDRSQVDRLFRQSGLMRPKWDQRRGEKTYGERTLDRAMDGDVYDPSRVSQGGEFWPRAASLDCAVPGRRGRPVRLG